MSDVVPDVHHKLYMLWSNIGVFSLFSYGTFFTRFGSFARFATLLNEELPHTCTPRLPRPPLPPTVCSMPKAVCVLAGTAGVSGTIVFEEVAEGVFPMNTRPIGTDAPCSLFSQARR